MNHHGRPRPRLLVTSCEGCGACCTVVTSPPFRRHLDGEGEEGWERLKFEHPGLLAEILDHDRRRLAEGAPSYGSPCLWYDPATQLCRHHDLRPALCRAFAVGEMDCLDARRRAGIV